MSKTDFWSETTSPDNKHDRFRSAELIFTLLAGGLLSPLAIAEQQTTPPTESINAQAVHGAQVVTPPTPPAGFNPLTATDEELGHYNLPPRPDPQQAPNEFNRWQKMVTVPQKQFTPIVQQSTVRHHLPQQHNEYNREANGVRNATSSNWAGYAASVPTNTFTSQNATVTAQISVPTVTAANCNDQWEYSSEWVGFDGLNNSDVLQAGIEADAICSGRSSAEYYGAWFEWYPNYSYRLTNFPISPGETIDVSVWYTTSAPNGHAYFANYQTGQSGSISFNIPSGTTYQGNSAEWILERPEVNGALAVLPNYVSDTFNGADATSTRTGSISPGSCSTCNSVENIEMASGGTAITTVKLSGNSTVLFTQPEATTPTPPSLCK